MPRWLLVILTCMTVGRLQAQPELLCMEFNALNTRIRDGLISPPQARPEVIRLLAAIRQASDTSTPTTWIFPLKGYDLKAIGGQKGNGYITRGYDFFEGNRHGGHPAHDIFIRDRNQDCRDDRTGNKVPVVAIAAGIVVGFQTTWRPGSALRGGKYVLVFHPAANRISYYAHLDSVQVDLGQTLTAGQPLGLLGRTGLNAYKKRSPTHLHLMVLQVDAKHGLRPVDPYSWWATPPPAPSPRAPSSPARGRR